MQTIEFIAKPENGYFKIPEQYQNDILGQVKIIVISDILFKDDSLSEKKKFKALKIKTKGFQFNREQANER